MRHNLKRKSQTLNQQGIPAAKKTTFETTSAMSLPEDDATVHLKELQEEWKKPIKSRSMKHIKVLLNETRAYRSHLLNKSQRLLKEVIDNAPCFKDGTYVLYEFRQSFGKERLDQTLVNLETALRACHVLMGKPLSEDLFKGGDDSELFQAVLKALNYIEAETKFDRNRKGKCHFQTSVQIVEDVEEQDFPTKLETSENTPPKLIIFRGEDNVQAAYIVGDCTTIMCFGDCLLVFTIQLFATYYVFDIQYPKSLAMFLGFLQQFVFEEQYTNESSKKFKFLCKKFRAVFDKLKL